MSPNMLSALYMGRENAKVRQMSVPIVGAHDVLIQNIYSSICGTDAAVYTKGSGTGHRITEGGKFGHETILDLYMQTGKSKAALCLLR